MENIPDYKYVNVLVNEKHLGTRTFSYLVSEQLKKKVKIGQAVIVPFGANKVESAFVVGFSNYLEDGIKAKYIIDILDEVPLFDLKYLEFLNWVADYYFCSIQDVFQAAFPLQFLKQPKKFLIMLEEPQETVLSCEEQLLLNFFGCEKKILYNTLLKRSKLSLQKFSSVVSKMRKKSLLETRFELENEKQNAKTVSFVEICSDWEEKVKSLVLTKRQTEILEMLGSRRRFFQTEFEKTASTTKKMLKNLESLGLVKIKQEQIYRDSLNLFSDEKLEPLFELNQYQQEAYEKIKKKIETKLSTPEILLHGITASGKTEIYFHLIRDVLQDGHKNILMLFPEIALASQIAKRLVKKFGKASVAIWHSSVSAGEKFDVWQKLKKNEIRILLGARSAVFAPLQDIGLIIVDEEHESSYKQTMPNPRYNAVSVAKQLAKVNNIPIILGSATPDISSYYNCKLANNIVSLNRRYNDFSLATTHIIDMREEIFKTKGGFFSLPMLKAIETTLENNKQAILLINRRGFASSTICLACGNIIKCPKCDIPLILHKPKNVLKCHYCDFETSNVDFCPKCGSDALKNCGLGTQRVEEAAKKLFPNIKIARLDSDVMEKKNEHIKILDKFENGDISILIGTQMIAKGLDNKNVTFVGVLQADSPFTLPDYRSQERGFQLLTQVAGRSGRGENKGTVYFQTFNPNFFVIEQASKQNYNQFFETEIKSREMFDYPPFSMLFHLIFSSQNNLMASKSALEVSSQLLKLIKEKTVEDYIQILGPNPCLISCIKGFYRWQILIKNKLHAKGHRFLTSFFKSIKLPENVKMIVDVDPYDIL